MASKKNNNGGGIGRVSGLASGVGPTARHNEFIIDDESLLNPIIKDKVFCPIIDGEIKGHGLIKRDFAKYPKEMFSTLPKDFVIPPKSDWDAIIDEQEEQQSSLEHIFFRAGLEALDQDGQGYCWMYSGTMAVMLVRAKNNQPNVRLSAHAGAWLVKGGRDEGGWCGLGMKHLRDKGQPSVQFWPEKSMNGRAYNTPEVWANAALHKVTEDVADVGRPEYDQNMTNDMVLGLMLLNIPVPQDYDEWGHSICGIRTTRPERGSYARKIMNSWTKNWGDRGMGIIRASWTIDGAVAALVTGGSAT